MKYKIGNDNWEIVEHHGTRRMVDYEDYTIYKNGHPFTTKCGQCFETESGACYAILNEYNNEDNNE